MIHSGRIIYMRGDVNGTEDGGGIALESSILILQSSTGKQNLLTIILRTRSTVLLYVEQQF